jgi:hypothetical protein
MVDWQVTAVTINCDSVAAEVTIIVKSDGLVKCTGFDNLAASRKARLDLVNRSLTLKRVLDCPGTDCKHIKEYLQKLQAEELPTADNGKEK